MAWNRRRCADSAADIGEELMPKPRLTLSRRVLLKGAAAGAGVLMLDRAGAGRAAASTWSSTVAPYVLPSADGVETVSILTVGEAAPNGYRMVGIPDGLGIVAGDSEFTLVMNHELRAANGVTRSHGSKGAFVSRWTIDRRTLRVTSGRDNLGSAAAVHLWDPTARRYVEQTTSFDRFCSADLADPKAFRHGALGTDARILLNGEEVTGGRAFAHIVTGPGAGEAWQLPRLGRLSFENAVAAPHGKDRTIVVGLEDGSINTAPVVANNPSQVYVYVGEKRSSGTAVERAGLTNGKLHGLRVRRGGLVAGGESDAYGLGDAASGYVAVADFELVELAVSGDVSDWSGPQLETDAVAKEIFRCQRAEDGAWDPRGDRRGDFYFVTTANMTSNTRLWRLRFTDIERPEAGGTIEILVNASAGRMFDNITVDQLGRVLLQEDPGNETHIAKIWLYGIESRELIEVAHHDPAFFAPGTDPTRFVTQDEESSGIIDAQEVLGQGWFLFDVQVHKTNPDPELVEFGQLLAMYVPPRIGRGR